MGSYPALHLVVVQGLRHGETLEYQPGASIRIGRVVRGNTIPIKDAGISTKHLCIEFNFNSAKWVVRDLDSSNGSFLNGECLTPNTAIDLNDGDSIKIGEKTSILIKIDCQVESQLRRNPKRRAAAKDGSIGAVVKTRGRVTMEARTVDNDVEGDMDSRMQGRNRKARGLKDGNGDQTEGKKLSGVITGDSQNSCQKGMAPEDRTVEHVVEEDKIMLLDGRRQGRQRKVTVLKAENANQTEGKKTDDTFLGVTTGGVRNRSRKGMALKDSLDKHEDEGDKIILVESQRGGNPRKGRVLKDKNGDKGEVETVELFGVVKGDSKNQGHDGTTLKDSTVEHQAEGDKIMKVERPTRGRQRKGKVLKDENCDALQGHDSLTLKDSTVEHQAEGDKIMEVERPTRGRQRKGKVLKDENCDALQGKKADNILVLSRRDSHIKGPIEGNIGGRMSRRRNRAVKGDENAVEKSILSKIPENIGLEPEKGRIEVRRTKAGMRERNELSKELPDNVQVDNLRKVSTKDAIEEIENNSDRVATTVSDIFESKDRNKIEEPCSVQDGSTNVENHSKTDDKENKGAEKLDLEKMTVGEWFDYLEVHLPAQIIDETKNYVERIKKKAARVREDVLWQMKQKGNLQLA